jgi:Xaa-Pro dipeptidase
MNTLLFDKSRLVSEMERENVDVVIATSRENVGYLSGYFTHMWTWDVSYLQINSREHQGTNYGIAAVIPKDMDAKEPFFVESYHKLGFVRSCGLWIKNVRPYSTNIKNAYAPQVDISGKALFQEQVGGATPLEAIAGGIRELGLEKKRLGIEGERLPANSLAELKALLPQAEFVNISDLLKRMRAVKTAEEIARMKHAYCVADKTYYKAFSLVKPGITPYEIFQEQMRTIIENHCYMAFQHVNFGGANDFAVAAGKDYRIKAGDHGVFDIGVYYEGYMTDFGRVCSVGQPRDEIRRVYEVVLGTRRKLMRWIEPGIKGSQLFGMAAKYLESFGRCPAINCIGHGLGIECHEWPFIAANDDTRVELGNTIVIEVYVEVPGVGAFLLENAGVVTENGWEGMTSLSDELIVL